MKKPIKKGDKVRWIAGDIWVGPKNNGKLAVRNGDVRTVLYINETGDKMMLSNNTDNGCFGWTEISNVERVSFLIAMETFFIRICCLFGLHKWKYFGDMSEYISKFRL